MKSKVEKYVNLVSFLSQSIGPDVILSLIDMSEGKTKILSMQYGKLDTTDYKDAVYKTVDYALKNKLHENNEYTSNIITVKSNENFLRTSIYFIKDDYSKLIGMLIIFFNDNRYEILAQEILKLAHPDKYVEQRYIFNYELMNRDDIIATGSEIEVSNNLDDVIFEEVDKELVILNKPVNELTKSEKVEIVKNLDEKGIFIMKGSVEILSEKLEVSQPTIYRYISEARE